MAPACLPLFIKADTRSAASDAPRQSSPLDVAKLIRRELSPDGGFSSCSGSSPYRAIDVSDTSQRLPGNADAASYGDQPGALPGCPISSICHQHWPDSAKNSRKRCASAPRSPQPWAPKSDVTCSRIPLLYCRKSGRRVRVRLRIKGQHLVQCTKALCPAYTATAPKSSSMRMSWLYFSTRSPRHGAPVLR